MKRRITRPTPYGNFPNTPLSPVPVGRVTTPQSVYLESIAETAKRNVQRENSPEGRAKNLRTFNYWIRSLNDIAADKNLDGAYAELGLPKYSDAEFMSVMKEPASFQNALAAFQAGLQALEQERGICLTEEGMKRFGAFVQVQLANGVRLSVSAIELMWDRLESLGVLSEDDFTVDPSLVVTKSPKQQAPAPAEPTLETIAVSTDAGKRQAAELLDTELTAEYQVMFSAWQEHLIRDYQHHLTDAQFEAAINWFRRNDGVRNMLRHDDWNACRRFLVSQSILPNHMLTPDERLSIRISQDPTPTQHKSFEDRRQLAAELNGLLTTRDSE